MTAHQSPSAGELWPDEEWCAGCGFAISGTYCEVCTWTDDEAREAWERIWVWLPVPGDQEACDAVRS